MCKEFWFLYKNIQFCNKIILRAVRIIRIALFIFLKKSIDNVKREEYNLDYNIKHIIPIDKVGIRLKDGGINYESD